MKDPVYKVELFARVLNSCSSKRTLLVGLNHLRCENCRDLYSFLGVIFICFFIVKSSFFQLCKFLKLRNFIFSGFQDVETGAGLEGKHFSLMSVVGVLPNNCRHLNMRISVQSVWKISVK